MASGRGACSGLVWSRSLEASTLPRSPAPQGLGMWGRGHWGGSHPLRLSLEAARLCLVGVVGPPKT